MESRTTIAKNNLIGMVLITLGQVCFGSIMTIEKLYANEQYTESQFLFYRYFVQLILAAVNWKFCKPASKRKASDVWYGAKKYRLNVWIRGLLHFINLFCNWHGLHYVNIGDGTLIYYLSPIVIVFIAHVFLHETLPKLYPISIFFAIIASLLIIQPEFIFQQNTDYDTEFQSMAMQGLIFILIAMFAWSFCVILVRTALPVHYLQLEMVSSLQAIAIWVPLLLIVNTLFIHNDRIGTLSEWHYSSMKYNFIMVSIGVIGFIGLLCNTVGYQYGEATKITWLEYVELVLAYVYQIVLFKETPNMWAIIGCFVMVIAAAVIPLLEELAAYLQPDKSHDHDIAYVSQPLDSTAIPLLKKA